MRWMEGWDFERGWVGEKLFDYIGIAWNVVASLAIPSGHSLHLTVSQSHNAQGNIVSPQLGQVCFSNSESSFTSVSQCGHHS